MRRLFLTAAALTGCETTGLYSAAALEQLYDVSPVPEEPAWELRWLGEDVGLELGCALIPVGDFAPELIGGTITAAPPDVGTPQHWNEADGYRWAVGLLVLVNPEQYEPDELEEEEEEAEGVWGGVESRALLFAQGDREAVTEELVVGEDGSLDAAFFAAVEGGGQWVGVVPELVSQLGTLAGAMYPLADVEWRELEAEGLFVTASERLSVMSSDMLSGASLGGVRWGCDQ